MAGKGIAHEDGSAMMVFEIVMAEDFIGLAVGGDGYGFAADLVTAGGEDVVATHDRRGNDGSGSGPFGPPEHLAILGCDADEALHGELHILQRAIDGGGHEGGVLRGIGEV